RRASAARRALPPTSRGSPPRFCSTRRSRPARAPRRAARPRRRRRAWRGGPRARHYDFRAVGAGQRLAKKLPSRLELRIGRTRNPGAEIWLWSRLALWAAAVFAYLWFEPNRHPQAGRWDSPLIHTWGYGLDVWARWDSVFFVRIAQHGYDAASAAFYPLYPGLVAAAGRAFGGQYVLAGVAISLASCAAAFALLYRLAEEKLGAAGA